MGVGDGDPVSAGITTAGEVFSRQMDADCCGKSYYFKRVDEGIEESRLRITSIGSPSHYVLFLKIYKLFFLA